MSILEYISSLLIQLHSLREDKVINVQYYSQNLQILLANVGKLQKMLDHGVHMILPEQLGKK